VPHYAIQPATSAAAHKKLRYQFPSGRIYWGWWGGSNRCGCWSRSKSYSWKGGSSYIKVAGNLSFSGESALGKVSFGDQLKSGFVAITFLTVSSSELWLIPLPDFPDSQQRLLKRFPVAPYVGAGIAIRTNVMPVLVHCLLLVQMCLWSLNLATAAVDATFGRNRDINRSWLQFPNGLEDERC